MKLDTAATLAPAGPPPALGTVLPPTDTCAALERRLKRETQGEVLFDAGSRGRYAF